MNPLVPAYKFFADTLPLPLEDFISGSTSLLVLHDGCLGQDFMPKVLELAPTTPTILDVRQTRPGLLSEMSPETNVLYAVFQDDLGLPFIDWAYNKHLKVLPVWYAQPRDYLSRNMHARRSLTTEVDRQSAAGFLKMDGGPGDFINLIQAFEATRGRPGCVVEVGCFLGSSAGVLLSYARSRQAERGSPDSSFYYLDVFEGFDYPEANTSSDAVWAGTHCTDGYEAVRSRIQSCGEGVAGMEINVMRCNVISDPIPEAIVRSGVRLANIDVDLYEAVVAGLDRFAPLIVPGGIMICEDAGHTPLLIGALKALEEFMASEAGRQFCRIDLASGQSLLVKIGA